MLPPLLMSKEIQQSSDCSDGDGDKNTPAQQSMSLIYLFC